MTSPKTEINYGFVNPETASEIQADEVSEGVAVRVFEVSEDSQWCLGVLMKRADTNKVAIRPSRLGKSSEELMKKAAKAREEGNIPFRVAGDKESVADFFLRSGIKLESLET